MYCNAAAAATCRNDTSLLRTELGLQSHERGASAIGASCRCKSDPFRDAAGASFNSRNKIDSENACAVALAVRF